MARAWPLGTPACSRFSAKRSLSISSPRCRSPSSHVPATRQNCNHGHLAGPASYGDRCPYVDPNGISLTWTKRQQMSEGAEFVVRAALMGIGATVVMDLWAAFLTRLLGVRGLNYGLVGRWFGHLPRGHFVHDDIAQASPVPGELAIGWGAHYAIGIVFAALLWRSGASTGRVSRAHSQPWPSGFSRWSLRSSLCNQAWAPGSLLPRRQSRTWPACSPLPLTQPSVSALYASALLSRLIPP
jgi:hypothetical protein